MVIDVGWLERTPAHLERKQFELGCFEIQAELRSMDLGRVRQRVHERLRLSPRVWREKEPFRFDPETLVLQDDVRLFGYWQSERYFVDHAAEIRDDFRFRVLPDDRNRALATRIAHTPAVSVHVRRGDYVTNPATKAVHGALPLDYYHAAVDRIRESEPEPHFYVFSDDPDWCSANLDLGGATTVVDHNRGRGSEDLRLMSLCSHHVIANSSFSWWGAWLNAREDKIVVAPQEWMRDDSFDTRDLVPEGWIRI